MKLVEVKVGELIDFVQSEYFRQIQQIPISSPRAFSQAINPSASPSDVALAYALDDNNTLTGYIGIIPATLNTGDLRAHKVYFNSCWWVHPRLGKTTGMRLFYRMLQLTGNRMAFFELTPRTEKILHSIQGMVFPPSQQGMKASLGIAVPARISKSFAGNLPVLAFMHSICSVINFPINLRNRLWLSDKNNTTEITIEYIDFPDKETWNWTRQFTQGKTVFREYEEMKWATGNPWMVKGESAFFREQKRYFFSLLAYRWKQFWIKVSVGEKLAGLLFFTGRDGNYRIPYAWYSMNDAGELGQAIMNVLVREKAYTLTCYSPLLVMTLKQAGRKIFLKVKPLSKVMAWTSEIDPLLKGGIEMQDGDGDAVFT